MALARRWRFPGSSLPERPRKRRGRTRWLFLALLAAAALLCLDRPAASSFSLGGPSVRRLGVRSAPVVLRGRALPPGSASVPYEPNGGTEAVAAASPEGPTSIGGLIARGAAGVAAVLAGLLALLYITSGFEALMHRSTGLLTSRSPIIGAATGLAVGTLHTFAGPDHLAGLAPLVIGQRRSPLAALGLGALWGSGHATGQLLIGLVCLAVHVGLLRMTWAPALGQASGILVGLSLIALGALGLYEARQYERDEADGDEEPRRDRFGWATYATGVLHGLSPDAVIFIVPALALPRLAAVCHVAGVVSGTLLSMGGYTALLSVLCRRSPNLGLISAGAASMAALLGVSIVAASLGFHVALPGL
eukprot:TRINITY_DN63062_c0_g1_i1.p1 TRINITY_DN63062_c0_g1~~TRINITY_DN63062_c0_g1_i1.p1  ORF type:complete len:362 (+),score=58.59 TRINITY_DN63062_c0_g1_i1:109-1194(+)